MSKAKGASPGRNRASWPDSARKAAQARGIIANRRGNLGEIAFVHKAMTLGFVVAKPYGNIHRYDFIVEGGHKLWRVQVKACTSMKRNLYCVVPRCRTNSVDVAYTKSELDFLAAYIIPEETWYVLPMRVVVKRYNLLFRPKGYAHRDRYARYREAWHLLGKPDSPVF
jgi:hypothetical protein